MGSGVKVARRRWKYHRRLTLTWAASVQTWKLPGGHAVGGFRDIVFTNAGGDREAAGGSLRFLGVKSRAAASPRETVWEEPKVGVAKVVRQAEKLPRRL